MNHLKRFIKVLAVALLVAFVTKSLIAPAAADDGMTSGRSQQYDENEAIVISQYDVIEDRTITASVQEIDRETMIVVAFTSPGKNKSQPDRVGIGLKAAHQEFRWNQVSKLLFRYGGQLHTFQVIKTDDGTSGYKNQLNPEGPGWLETVIVKPLVADFLEMSRAESIHIRVGDNLLDTFSLEGKTLGTFKAIASEINSLQINSKTDTPTPRSRAGDSQKTHADPTYDTNLIDLNTDKLPANYLGHDPIQVYNSLVKKLLDKQEYETSEDHKTRVKLELTKPVIGQITMRGYFVASIDLQDELMQYDADHKVLKVVEYVGMNSMSNPISAPRTFKVAEKTEVLNTYVGQNAFGVKRSVKKIRRNSCELVFNNPRDFGFKVHRLTGMERRIEYELPMNPNTAIAAKPNLRMLIVYQLVDPYVAYYESVVTPKINNPEELLLH